MIYVIGGEDIVSSRKKMAEILLNVKNVTRIDGKKVTIVEIDEALVGDSLFSESKTIVVENFKKIKSEAKFWELIESHHRTLVDGSKSKSNVILWDEEDASRKKLLKGIQVFNFSFPKFYYQFLDNFEPSSKKTFGLLREVLKTLEPEQVLYGLTRRVRQLLFLKSNNHSNFSEFARMQNWQLAKLNNQSNLWTKKQLKKVFTKLSELDEKLKTGGLPTSLSKHLDILLLSDLN